jgi:YjbE family integral membrane protein
MEAIGPSLLQILQIIGVNIVLSGDNAVVIAMACRGLPARRRMLGMILGSGVAVGLRVVFTYLVVLLLATPFLKIVGGLLLLWIAVKLLVDGDDESDIPETDRLWYAVRTVAIADAVMSLDNVLAIAGVARDSTFLLMLGLLISIPLIVAGAALIMALLDRFPIIVWAGAALLGWIAGEMLITDPVVINMLADKPAFVRPDGMVPSMLKATAPFHYGASSIGAILVVLAGYLWKRRTPRAADPVTRP